MKVPLQVSLLKRVATGPCGPHPEAAAGAAGATGAGAGAGAGIGAGTGAGFAASGGVHLHGRHLGSAMSGICFWPLASHVSWVGSRQWPFRSGEPHSMVW